MMPTHYDRERFAQSHRQDAAHARQGTSGGFRSCPCPIGEYCRPSL